MNDEADIVRLFGDGDRALMSADLEELRRIYADDYVQYDEGGIATSRRDLIAKLSSSTVRFVSMTSTGRQVRLFGDFAIVHGSEDDVVEQGGQRFPARYVYMDVVVKRDGRWQIVGSQLAKQAE